MKKAMRVYERIEGYLAFLAIILLIFMTLMVTRDVIGRHFFNFPQKGAMELCENSLVWFTFLSAAWILRREKHVMVRILVDSLSSRAQAFLGIVTSIIGGIVSLTIVIFGIGAAWQTWERGIVQISTLGLPLGPLYTVIPFGCAFLVVRFGIRTYGYIVEWRTPAEKEEMPFEELVEV